MNGAAYEEVRLLLEANKYPPQVIGAFRAEVLHETPLFLAEYDGAESEVHLTLDDARAMCDDIAKSVAGRQCWDWSRDEDGVYVQFWTHEDDDRPLHVTGGTVTEIRVQRPEAEQGEKDTPTGATSTHQHTPRERHLLLAKAIREQGGEWTTRRARTTYRALGINGLFRSTLRRDLAELHRDGHLTLHDEKPGRRYYTPTTEGGSR